MIAVEQVEVAGLRAGSAFEPAKPERREFVFNFLKIAHEIVAPEGGPFADGRNLGRLIVGQPERREVAMLLGEGSQGVNDDGQPLGDDAQRVAHDDQVGVVNDKCAGGAQVQNAAGARGDLSPSVHVGHHVVAQALLVPGGGGEINFLQGSFQFGDLAGRDLQARAPLRLGQGQPQATPGQNPTAGAEQLAYPPRGVSRDQRRFVEFVTRHGLPIAGVVRSKHRGEPSDDVAFARRCYHGARGAGQPVTGQNRQSLPRVRAAGRKGGRNVNRGIRFPAPQICLLSTRLDHTTCPTKTQPVC